MRLTTSVETLTDNLLRAFFSASDAQMREGLNWYETAERHCEQWAAEFGLSKDVVIAVVAVTSTATSWEYQLKNTARLLAALVDGEIPSFVTYGRNLEKALNIVLDGNTALVSGPKVEAFARNIAGDYTVATLDRHAYRAAVGYFASDAECSDALRTTGKTRRAIDAAYHAAAREVGLTVAQFQAVVWTVVRFSDTFFNDRAA